MKTVFRALVLTSFAGGCAAVPLGVHLREVEIPAPALAGSVLANPSTLPALVLLPPDYERGSRRYPVLYYLPGFTTDPIEYFDGAYDGLDFRRVFEGFEAIVVVPTGRDALGGSFYADSPVTGNWARYVAEDVVPFVDRTFRTLPDRDARLLAGDSMGGFGALSIGIDRADLIGSVYALSPGVFAPGGLEDQGMADRPALVRARELDAERMHGWSGERFLHLVGDLYRNGSRFNYARGFAYAYGAAFAPEPDTGPPWSALPWRARARYRAGFGGWERRLAERRASATPLPAVGLDVGRNDRATWIPAGARHLAALLEGEGAAVELAEHDGGHVDRLGERIEMGLVPFARAHLGGQR